MQEKLFPSSVHVQSCDVQVHHEKKPSLPMAIYHNTFPNSHRNTQIKRVKKERDEIREWINLNEIQSSDNIMTLQTTTTTAIITTGICMI